MDKPLLIAVVDDELSVRKALRRLLLASNHQVTTYASGQEFLDAVSQHRPDCLVLDLHMPGLTGLDVQKELSQRGVAVPVVMITAFDEPECREQSLAAGAADYLLKPFDDEALLDAIARSVSTEPSD